MIRPDGLAARAARRKAKQTHSNNWRAAPGAGAWTGAQGGTGAPLRAPRPYDPADARAAQCAAPRSCMNASICGSVM